MQALLGALMALNVMTSPAAEQETLRVRVTFYTLRGTMASGSYTHKDAAACSDWLPMGTKLMFPDGWIVTCLDRGMGDIIWNARRTGHDAWVDVWAPSYAWGIRYVEGDYGTTTQMQMVRWGWGDADS
jgi:hypothetical protein